jgi:hypothetical protein
MEKKMNGKPKALKKRDHFSMTDLKGFGEYSSSEVASNLDFRGLEELNEVLEKLAPHLRKLLSLSSNEE